MKKRAFTLAMAFIGCVAGAGFASGKEILTFFGGPLTVVMMALAAILFCYLSYVTVTLSERVGATSYREFVGVLFHGKSAVLINLLLLGAFVIISSSMIAATEHVFSSLNMGALPTLTVTLICAVVASGGLKWVAGNGAAVMLAFTAVNLLMLFKVGEQSGIEFVIGSETQNAFPIVKAFAYVGFNTLMSFGVLCGTGQGKREARAFAVMSAAGIFALMILLWLCMTPYLQQLSDKAMPMLYVAQSVGGMAEYLLVAAMLAGIVSTLVAQLHSAAEYFEGRSKGLVISCLTVVSYTIAQIGFAGIVDILYPALGLLSAAVFVRIIYINYRGKKNAS